MQFDVHRNLGRGKDTIPFFIDLQHDRFATLRTRVVAPLLPIVDVGGADRLSPVINVLGNPHILSTAEVFAIDRTLLGPVVANVAIRRDRIVAALDLLFTGI